MMSAFRINGQINDSVSAAGRYEIRNFCTKASGGERRSLIGKSQNVDIGATLDNVGKYGAGGER
jgi:hypothetical protein